MPKIMYKGTKDGRKPAKFKRTYIKRFSNKDLERCLHINDYKIPLEKLIEYGNKCRWTTKAGKPFYNIDTFCWFFNNIYFEDKIKEEEQEFRTKYMQTLKNNLL